MASPDHGVSLDPSDPFHGMAHRVFFSSGAVLFVHAHSLLDRLLPDGTLCGEAGRRIRRRPSDDASGICAFFLPGISVHLFVCVEGLSSGVLLCFCSGTGLESGNAFPAQRSDSGKNLSSSDCSVVFRDRDRSPLQRCPCGASACVPLFPAVFRWKFFRADGFAAILPDGFLFGTDNLILSALAHHKTDAIFRVFNTDRYDDRDVLITNLLDSYNRLIAFGEKHLNDLFTLDGIISVSARDKILREIVSNLLAHRDFSSAYVAKLVIEKERIFTENSSRSHGYGALRLSSFEPFPKNPAPD